MRIYKTTDRVPVKIGDAVFILSPLSRQQKQDIIQASTVMRSGEKTENGMSITTMSMKFAIKGVSGLQGFDGKDYAAKFDLDGLISDESIEDLLNIEESLTLMQAMSLMTHGFGKIGKVPGVEIQEVSVEKKS